mmetsp:Transcript_30009/g.29256  ORF Transcript_30009/g.29256 Transcript_30009/m.29256 type:complete len:232 (-) Transcript_30009:5-700(-)
MEEFSSFNTKDAVVWIDPLDGTSDFAKGNLSAVTVLIGVSINGYSRIGVIHSPFTNEDERKGRTLFGTMEHGVYRLYFDEELSEEQLAVRVPGYMKPFDHFEQIPPTHSISVAASLTHMTPEMQQIIATIAPVEIKRYGGAGNKCFNVIYGRVDSYLHPDHGLKFWDLCAPETLIKAMGGYATDINEKRLVYSLDGNRKLPGLLLARTPPVYNLIVNRLGDVLTNLKGKFQ